MGFILRKAKQKTVLTHPLSKLLLKWAKEKATRCVDNWMEVIFNDELLRGLTKRKCAKSFLQRLKRELLLGTYNYVICWDRKNGDT